MSTNRTKCGCGRKVAEGSVFCVCCRAEVKRKNLKILNRGKLVFVKKS